MSLQSPDVVLYDGYGIVMPVQNGTAIPAGTSGLLFAGSDGTTARTVSTDTSGRVIVIGAATDNTANVTTKLPVIPAVVNTLTPLATATDMISLSVTAGTAGNGGGGLLRIDSVYPIGTANTVALDAAQSGGLATTAAPSYTNNQVNPLSLDGYGNLRTLVAGTGAAGSPSSTNVVTVQGVTGGTPMPVSGSLTVDKSSTGTITSVAGNTSSVTLLAANTNRISASIYNATNKVLYVAMAATATTSTYTVQVAQNAYYELTVDYTGIITGISPNGVNGNVLITEYT